MTRDLLPLLLAACVLSAAATTAQSATVVEMRNALGDRYFLTADPAELAALESGAAGPGWGRTGRAFLAFAPDVCAICPPVTRYYNPTLGAHFYTRDPAEVGRLRQPGSQWTLEGIAFRQSQVFPADGPCGSSFHTWSIYRFYRPQSGHRYVGGGLRETMRNKGWIDEGLAFCLSGDATQAFKQFFMPQGFSGRIRSLDDCKALGGPCLALTNIEAREVAIDESFATRMKFDTRGRPEGTLASVGPYYALVGPDRDESFRPFSGYVVETELRMLYTLEVYTATAEPGSHVYGHPTIEFVDRASGLPLHFSVLTYGRDPGGDFLGRDALTGAVIVGTTYRPSTPYGRSTNTPTLRLPLEYPVGAIRGFDFSVNREEFQRILDSARQLDPGLSANPSDYAVTAFRHKNEIVGNGSVDTRFLNFTLYLNPAD